MMSTFVILAVAGLAAAQDGLPSCAQTCVGNFTTGSNIGGCPQLDIKCICSQQSFLGDIACCLQGQCDDADQQSAISYAKNICGTVGVTVPSSIVCSKSSASASAASATASATAAHNAGSARAESLVSGSVGVLGALLAVLAYL